MIVQIFVPLSLGEGLLLDSKLAIIARDAYEGQRTVSDIWFRNVRINEVGSSSDAWFQTNVLAEFFYEELK